MIASCNASISAFRTVGAHPARVQDYILALEARVAALEATVQELLERVNRTRARRRVRPRVIRLSRGGEVARDLLGTACDGILITDRWSAYNWDPVRWRQRCWAHLLQDIEAMIGRGGRSQDIGEVLRRHAQQMFHWQHRVRAGTRKRSSFRSSMTPVRREGERRLEAGSRCGEPKTAGVCRDIRKRRQALGTFGHLAGVEPTNNAAERAICPGVLWRKGSCGTQSVQGSRFVETMMTVVTTLKQQHRNPLDDLTTVCKAALRGAAAPSLLPVDDPACQQAAA